MRFNDTTLRTAVILPFLTLLLLSGCGESPTGPAGEHVRPKIGSRYFFRTVEVEYEDGVVYDSDTNDFEAWVETIDTLNDYDDVYGLFAVEHGDTSVIKALQYLDNGDVRYIAGTRPYNHYLHPHGGSGETQYDTIDTHPYYSEHAARFERVESVTVDGRSYDASVVSDLFMEFFHTGGHPSGIGYGGLMTSYYAPAIGLPVVQRFEMGEVDEVDGERRVAEPVMVSTTTLLRIEE